MVRADLWAFDTLRRGPLTQTLQRMPALQRQAAKFASELSLCQKWRILLQLQAQPAARLFLRKLLGEAPELMH